VLARHVVVDGSNIATEGRSLPSLAQLDEAVREYRREFPDDTITVVVDATFGHRIPEAERKVFDEAVAHNELVSPPAGAIGRGDAFLLRVAEKVHATVLSNDSFQEFHGEYEWLFDFGRLIGGKPVPGVGWIFTPRTPVRGPRSREATRSARSDRKPKAVEQQKKKVQRAIEVATEEAVEPDSATVRRRRRSRAATPPADPLNAPLTFIEFVAGHPLGSDVEGEVETFSCHGAFVMAGGARCYIPLSALGNPPPRAAKEVLRRGEIRTFVLQALDPPRRGIELALAEFAQVSGEPRPETVEDEIAEGAPTRRRRGRSPTTQILEPLPFLVPSLPGDSADAAIEAAPAKRSRKAAAEGSEPRKRAPRKAKKAAAAEADSAPSEDVVPAPAPAPDVVAPARKRTPRKKAAAAVVTESERLDPVGTLVPVEAAAPAKRAARRRVVVAPPPAVAVPADETAPGPKKRTPRTRVTPAEPAPEIPAKPARTPRRRTARSSAVEADPVPAVGAPSETTAPVRKRAPRKPSVARPPSVDDAPIPAAATKAAPPKAATRARPAKKLPS